jgi:hypothetical protein
VCLLESKTNRAVSGRVCVCFVKAWVEVVGIGHVWIRVHVVGVRRE